MGEEEAQNPQIEAKISEEKTEAKQLKSQRKETNPKVNSPKESRQKEREEEIKEERDDNHIRKLSATEYFSSVSSFDIENERQIHVDPISLTEIGMLEDQDSPLSVPSFFTEVVVHSPILPPLRTPRFVSASLPCSATSSPHRSFSRDQKWEEPNLQPHQIDSPRTLARQHSQALSRFANGRSKSFGEGRTFAHNDTFDVLGRRHNNSCSTLSSSSTTSPESPKPKSKPRTKGSKDDDFKCGALCMNLPSFSKKKTMHQLRQQVARASGVSRRASLEKFDCGSWSPPCNTDYQDTPFEMDQNSGDAETPVRTAFVFDGVERRGILKKSNSRLGSNKSLGSSASNRHVRFSIAINSPSASCPSSPAPSSPSMLAMSISPRLRKYREEFNAFLEAAQSA